MSTPFIVLKVEWRAHYEYAIHCFMTLGFLVFVLVFKMVKGKSCHFPRALSWRLLEGKRFYHGNPHYSFNVRGLNKVLLHTSISNMERMLLTCSTILFLRLKSLSFISPKYENIYGLGIFYKC